MPLSPDQRPHVLLVNDDGIAADGLLALADAMRPHADLTIVAPLVEQSGMSHALSVFKDLHLETFERHGEQFGWSLAGTPVDCVKVALVDMRHERPVDLVISGINRGENAGISILYSGTVAAAREAGILGYPAIAVSLLYRDEAHLPFDVAGRVAVEVFQMVRKNGLPRGLLLNVNVPPVPYEQIKGWAVTRMGNSGYVDHYIRPSDADDGPLQNVGKGKIRSQPPADDLDDHALANDFVSITPLQADLTAHEYLPLLRTWLSDKS